MIVTETRRNPNLAFSCDSKENIDFLMAENKRNLKNLEATKKQIEQIQAENHELSSTPACLQEIQGAIYGRIQGLGYTMRHLYEDFVTFHKEVLSLHYIKNKSQEDMKDLKFIHAAIIMIHQWGTKYRSTSRIGQKDEEGSKVGEG